MFKRICVEVNEIFYKSLYQAGKELGIDTITVKNRALSDKWDTYKIVKFKIINTTKQCSKCKEIKSLELFPKSKSNLDGKSSWCWKCKSLDNMIRDQKDRSKSRIRTKKYHESLAGKIRRRVDKAVRRARLKGAYVKLTIEERKLIKDLYTKARELREQGIMVVVDHIIPISRKGKHKPNNLRIVTKEFNSKKNNKLDCELIT